MAPSRSPLPAISHQTTNIFGPLLNACGYTPPSSVRTAIAARPTHLCPEQKQKPNKCVCREKSIPYAGGHTRTLGRVEMGQVHAKFSSLVRLALRALRSFCSCLHVL